MLGRDWWDIEGHHSELRWQLPGRFSRDPRPHEGSQVQQDETSHGPIGSVLAVNCSSVSLVQWMSKNIEIYLGLDLGATETGYVRRWYSQ